jgi:hypothetical protein
MTLPTLQTSLGIQQGPEQSTDGAAGTQGLIFVIDSNDRDRIDEARTELTRIIQDREMKDALLLVFANKQDLQGGMYCGKIVVLTHADFEVAMRPKEVSDRLQLEKIAKDHVWKVEPSCATTGEGIFEGLVRLTVPHRNPKANMTPGMALEQRQATCRQQIGLTSPSSTDMTACAYSLASCIYPAPHSNAPHLQPYCLLILATTYAGSSFASSTSSISTRLSMCGLRYPSQTVYTVTLVYHVDLLLDGVSALCSARLWVVLFLDDYMHTYELLTLFLDCFCASFSFGTDGSYARDACQEYARRQLAFQLDGCLAHCSHFTNLSL